MTTASIINMRKCRECPFYVVLNDHHIMDGHPYWTCSKGLHPDYCWERRKRLVEERQRDWGKTVVREDEGEQ